MISTGRTWPGASKARSELAPAPRPCGTKTPWSSSSSRRPRGSTSRWRPKASGSTSSDVHAHERSINAHYVDRPVPSRREELSLDGPRADAARVRHFAAAARDGYALQGPDGQDGGGAGHREGARGSANHT